MAWTQEDADKLRAAILALASGEAVQSVSYAGPPTRTVVYMQRDQKKMEDLLAKIEASLSVAAGRKRYRLAATKKGFDS